MDAALKKLHDGITKFHATQYQGDNAKGMADLVKNGQHPDYYFIMCSDSRYDSAQFPTILPGDDFKSEHVANLVLPHTTPEALSVGAAIEYAVKHLKVKHLIIMGHTHCGGIQGLVNGMDTDPDAGMVGKWLATASDIMDRVSRSGDARTTCDHAEKEAIIWSLENLKRYPVVTNALENGGLQVHGWRYDIETGAVEAYDEASGEFTYFFNPDSNTQAA